MIRRASFSRLHSLHFSTQGPDSRHVLPPRTLLGILLAVVLAAAPASSIAQIQHGGTPYSFTHKAPGNAPVATMKPVNVEQLRAEDRVARRQSRPVPPRFGKALDVTLGIQDDGRWTTLPDTSGRLWRLRSDEPGTTYNTEGPPYRPGPFLLQTTQPPGLDHRLLER